MRFQIVNLPPQRLSGLSEDYANNISNFKEILSKVNKESRDQYARDHPAPPPRPQPPEPSPATEEPGAGARLFTWKPRGFGTGAPPPPGVSVTGGIPSFEIPSNPPLPPVPVQTPGKCGPGFSWIVGKGCVKNTASEPDRPASNNWTPPPFPGALTPGGPIPPTSVATGLPAGVSRPVLPPPPSSPVKPTGNDVPSQDTGAACYSCGGSLSWGHGGGSCIKVDMDQATCQASSHGVPSIPGGITGGGIVSPTSLNDFNPAGATAATFGIQGRRPGFLGQVQLRRGPW